MELATQDWMLPRHTAVALSNGRDPAHSRSPFLPIRNFHFGPIEADIVSPVTVQQNYQIRCSFKNTQGIRDNHWYHILKLANATAMRYKHFIHLVSILIYQYQNKWANKLLTQNNYSNIYIEVTDHLFISKNKSIRHLIQCWLGNR